MNDGIDQSTGGEPQDPSEQGPVYPGMPTDGGEGVLPVGAGGTDLSTPTDAALADEGIEPRQPLSDRVANFVSRSAEEARCRLAESLDNPKPRRTNLGIAVRALGVMTTAQLSQAANRRSARTKQRREYLDLKEAREGRHEAQAVRSHLERMKKEALGSGDTKGATLFSFLLDVSRRNDQESVDFYADVETDREEPVINIIEARDDKFGAEGGSERLLFIYKPGSFSITHSVYKPGDPRAKGIIQYVYDATAMELVQASARTPARDIDEGNYGDLEGLMGFDSNAVADHSSEQQRLTHYFDWLVTRMSAIEADVIE